MAVSTQSYKGARDFYPDDKRLQKYVFGVLRKTVESFGYQEYDAPIIEPLELYQAKTSQEIVEGQTFAFVDRGGRQVTLRPEMTPSVSRLVAARRQELNFPLRWYSLPNLWRYERPQKGRLREHYQLNVDLFGEASLQADHEIILIADSILKAFGAKDEMYTIKLNSRVLVQFVLGDVLGLDQAQIISVMRLVDARDKMEPGVFSAKLEMILSPSQREQMLAHRLNQVFSAKQINELPPEAHSHPSALKLVEVFELLAASGVKSARFDINLMRGFDYYTDIVFEVYDANPENNRSMFGGGRYDDLLSQFGVEPVPTVGFGMGDVTLVNFLEDNKLLPKLPPETDASVILVGSVYAQAQEILAEFRREGIRLAIDGTERKLDKKIKNASKAGIRYVMFLGSAELDSRQFKLKDLLSGKEETHGFERTVSILASAHRQKKPTGEDD